MDYEISTTLTTRQIEKIESIVLLGNTYRSACILCKRCRLACKMLIERKLVFGLSGWRD